MWRITSSLKQLSVAIESILIQTFYMHAELSASLMVTQIRGNTLDLMIKIHLFSNLKYTLVLMTANIFHTYLTRPLSRCFHFERETIFMR